MCFKVFALCLILVCFTSVGVCIGESEGEICWVESLNSTGICRNISKCYTKLRMLLHEKSDRLPMCSWSDETRIVCCPVKNIIYETGIFGKMYQSVTEGIKRSKNVVCRYNGGESILCCPKKHKQAQLPPETGCPTLNISKPTSPVHIGWTKCMEYQRYVHRCVVSDHNPDVMYREDKCGIPRHYYKLVPRIAEHDFPHLALLGRANPMETASGVEWIGDGALVSDRFVLTAAHILIDWGNRPLRYVLLGVTNKTDIVNGLLFNIVRNIPYPLFVMRVKMYDIALVELDRSVMFSEFVRPACLPVPERQLQTSSYMTIADWVGSENFGSSSILMPANVGIPESPDECNKLQSRIFLYNSSSMICASKRDFGLNERRDTFNGGSPLMGSIVNLDCSYSIEGVLSFSSHYSRGSTEVYARVSHYLDWIVQNVWPDDVNEDTN